MQRTVLCSIPRSWRAHKTLLAFSLSLFALTACGADSNRLWGSAVKDYGGLPFDEVQIQYQEIGGKLDAMKVIYVQSPNVANERQEQVKVIGQAPFVEGQPNDLKVGGSVTRTVRDNSFFPKLKEGNITFSKLGKPGETAEGEFHATFEGGRTVNGEFSATVVKISAK